MEPIINPGGAGGVLIKESGSASFVQDVIQGSQERPVIVDFWAEWCGPCKQLTPILEKVVREKAGKVALIKVDIEKNRDIAGQLRIQSIPTVYAFYKGQPMDGFQGALPESDVRRFVDKLIEQAGGDGSPIDALLEEAAEALAAGDAAGAAQLYGHAAQSEPGHPGALGGLAQTYLAMGEHEEARRVLDMVPEDKRNDPAVQQAQAALELAEQTGDGGDVAELEQRVAAAPEDHQARFDLALALQGQGRRGEAVEHLLEIVRRDPAWNEGAARQQLLKIFEAAGPRDPVTLAGRRKLSSILFS